MKGRGPRSGLSEEDRKLWNEIRRSVKPLNREKGVPFDSELDDLAGKPPASKPRQATVEQSPGKPSRLPTAAAYYPPVSGRTSRSVAAVRLDDTTIRKLKKGKISVDARIDLHGMTQSRAHAAVEQFLRQSADAGDRIVLVITGKGRSGEGVLRRQVPLWLAEPALRNLVGGYRAAHVSHGGEGALYVRLRRTTRHRDASS